jgi:hypothetical protein
MCIIHAPAGKLQDTEHSYSIINLDDRHYNFFVLVSFIVVVGINIYIDIIHHAVFFMKEIQYRQWTKFD